MDTFTQVELHTGDDGRAQFRQTSIALDQGTAAAALSGVLPATGIQFRRSPVGFKSEFHCTGAPQWLFVLAGTMEIRRFGPGEHFLSADTLPAGAIFDPTLHGHRSAQVGDEPLVTLFVKL